MPIDRTPVETIEDIYQYYVDINPEENLYVGIELERSGVYRDSLQPVTFNGDKGYGSVFEKLIGEVGWEVIARDRHAYYELQRGETRITTEPDGRPELAGSPQVNLHDLAREFRLHDNELKEMGAVFNIAWIPMGMQPWASNDEIVMVPKDRYRIFSEISNTPWMQTFLKRINGIHVNFSYTTEENAIDKAQTAFRLIPMISAMYASSPFLDGDLTGYINTRRAHLGRNPVGYSHIPPTILDASFSYKEWIAHYLDLPILIMKREDGTLFTPERMTFHNWLQDGYEGRQPTLYDFDQHIKNFWTDLRLRPSYLEYRVADSTPYKYAMALCALLKGLLFDSENRSAVAELTKDWTYEDILNAEQESWKTGLQTQVKGHPLLRYAQELLIIANEKLHSFQRLDGAGTDETVYLTPLKEQIFIKEKSFAEEMIDLYTGEWNGDPNRILEWCEAE